jgi:hypothetical protein
MRTITSPLLLLILSACASGGVGGAATSPYARDLDRLRADCDARGGSLVPVSPMTGQASTDYVCHIRNATSEALRR